MAIPALSATRWARCRYRRRVLRPVDRRGRRELPNLGAAFLQALHPGTGAHQGRRRARQCPARPARPAGRRGHRARRTGSRRRGARRPVRRRRVPDRLGTSTNMNANEVDRDPRHRVARRRRGDRRSTRTTTSTWARAQTTSSPRPSTLRRWTRSSVTSCLLSAGSADAFDAKATEFADVVRRPAPPAGRRADHPRAGVLGLRERDSPRRGADRGDASARVRNWRSAAQPRHGPRRPPRSRRAHRRGLRAVTGHPFRRADNPFEAMQNRDAAVELSGALRTVAVG